MPGGVGIEGGGQFFAQGGAERGFQPIRHHQGIDHGRPAFAVLDREHFGQGLRLGRQLGAGRIGARLGFPGCCQGGCGRRANLFDLLQGVAEFGQRGFGGGLLALGFIQPGRIDLLGADPGVFFLQAGELFADTTRPLFGLQQHLRGGLHPRIGLGGGFGGAVGIGLGLPHGFGGLGGGRRGGFGTAGMASVGLGQRRRLGIEALLGGGSVAAHLLGMREIAAELLQAADGIGQGGAGAAFLGGELLLDDAMAFQARARGGFGVA